MPTMKRLASKFDIIIRFHPGKPIFHDCKKGWDCCKGVAYDWEEFKLLEGCSLGKHSDVKEET